MNKMNWTVYNLYNQTTNLKKKRNKTKHQMIMYSNTV